MSPVLRAKGFVWYAFNEVHFSYSNRIASRAGYMGEWEKAGEIWSLDGDSEWLCNIPESEWLGDPEKIKRDFAEGVGDKRQEIVCIN